jgi:amino acid adenylation domain-containing protein
VKLDSSNNLRLATGQPVLKLPYNYQKTPDTSSRPPGTVNFSFDQNIINYLVDQDVDRLGPFMASAFVVLLYRYTGQSVIPLSISPDFLSKGHISTQVQTQGKMTFEDIYQKVGELIRIHPQTIHSPGQVHFSMNDSHGLPKDKFHQLDIHLALLKDNGFVAFSIHYNAALFRADTIERMGNHYQNLINSILDKGRETMLSELMMFNELENKWFVQISTGGISSATSDFVHYDIEQHAENQPNKVAVTYKEHTLTYEQLNQRSNLLASILLEKEAGPESRIVVCLEPSVDVAVALLAILKVGATYVPMNPSHPEFRIRTILEDTNPVLVLTNSTSVHKFEGFSEYRIDKLSGNNRQSSNPQVRIRPDQTAYIYYTSGTTGKPKGSLGTYDNLNHYIRVSQDRYGFTSSEIMTSLASYTFSISMFELLSPLVAGGMLRIMDRQSILDAEAMVKTLQEVTFVHAGPSLLKSLVNYIIHNVDDYSVFNGLRHLSSGGDMVPPDLLRKLQLIFYQTELFVIYGCSEIACMGCTYPIDPVRPIEKTYVGKPFKDVSILLLDKDNNVVPIGVTGEVCIGGRGVAAQYLNQSELTSEKFFIHNNIRYYRTGDVGRLTTGGDLELLGREDFQIQIHGMRVELGEVEYHLRQASAVKDAVVLAKKHGSVENTLVAYYIKKESYQVSSEDLRKFMTQFVPEYMVPAFYVQLDALPLNVNMKVDRKTLAQQDIVVQDPVEKPQSKSEKELASVWSELLKTDRIGLFDNFLAIGGDSLLAMEMIAKVRETMGVTLDGLSILRESLQMLAAMCDSHLGRSVTETNAQESNGNSYLLNRLNPVSSFFFGPDSSLYGLLHTPQKEDATQAVLICPPIGAAYKKCYFLLKLLGDELAEAGVPVLRFDYYATHDSMGEDQEASFDRWMSDIQCAYQELQERTGAEITVLGIRMGALLALRSLAEKDVKRWVLWDPVYSGNSYYQELMNMQKRKVWRSRTVRGYSKPMAEGNGVELIGFTYSDTAVKEMQTISADDLQLKSDAKVFHIHTKDIITDQDTHSWQRLLDSEICNVDVNCAWLDSVELTTTIIDKKILKQITKFLTDKSD